MTQVQTYHITPAMWALVDDGLKAQDGEGRLFFRSKDDDGHDFLERVVLVETSPVLAPPAHYGDLWPLDPRD